MKGATPAGARDERAAASWVRGMFSRIAPRYDLANHLLSFNLDRLWRAHTVKRLRNIVERPGSRVLDICCGTGDLLLALDKRSGVNREIAIFGSDFSHPMLVAASGKIGRRSADAVLFESDALQLPLRDYSLDVLTVAFGFRNLANYGAGLREIRRVLRPGGVVAILEFSQPPNRAFAAIYNFYSREMLPRIGGWLTGSRDAYTYLPESVSKFPSAPELAEEMRRANFKEVRFERLTGGIVALHMGERAG